MENLFAILIMASVICFILSWIYPKMFFSLFKNKFQKKGVRWVFGLSILFFFVLFGVTEVDE